MLIKPVNTAIVVSVGPLLDDTDGKSLETAIAYNAAGMSIDLFKETAAGVTKVDIVPTVSGAYDWTHKGNGVYELELPASANDTLGALWIVGKCDASRVFESPRYQVLDADLYDAIDSGDARTWLRDLFHFVFGKREYDHVDTQHSLFRPGEGTAFFEMSEDMYTDGDGHPVTRVQESTP